MKRLGLLLVFASLARSVAVSPAAALSEDARFDVFGTGIEDVIHDPVQHGLLAVAVNSSEFEVVQIEETSAPDGVENPAAEVEVKEDEVIESEGTSAPDGVENPAAEVEVKEAEVIESEEISAPDGVENPAAEVEVKEAEVIESEGTSAPDGVENPAAEVEVKEAEVIESEEISAPDGVENPVAEVEVKEAEVIESEGTSAPEGVVNPSPEQDAGSSSPGVAPVVPINSILQTQQWLRCSFQEKEGLSSYVYIDGSSFGSTPLAVRYQSSSGRIPPRPVSATGYSSGGMLFAVFTENIFSIELKRAVTVSSAGLASLSVSSRTPGLTDWVESTVYDGSCIVGDLDEIVVQTRQGYDKKVKEAEVIESEGTSAPEGLENPAAEVEVKEAEVIESEGTSAPEGAENPEVEVEVKEDEVIESEGTSAAEGVENPAAELQLDRL